MDEYKKLSELSLEITKIYDEIVNSGNDIVDNQIISRLRYLISIEKMTLSNMSHDVCLKYFDENDDSRCGTKIFMETLYRRVREKASEQYQISEKIFMWNILEFLRRFSMEVFNSDDFFELDSYDKDELIKFHKKTMFQLFNSSEEFEDYCLSYGLDLFNLPTIEIDLSEYNDDKHVQKQIIQDSLGFLKRIEINKDMEISLESRYDRCFNILMLEVIMMKMNDDTFKMFLSEFNKISDMDELSRKLIEKSISKRENMCYNTLGIGR